MKICCKGNKVCGSQRNKAKIVAYETVFSSRTAKEPSKEQSLLGSQFVYIGVISDDFTAVDFREELCYHSRPKKRKFKRCNER